MTQIFQKLKKTKQQLRAAGVLGGLALLVSCGDIQEEAMRSLQKDGYDFSVTDYLRAASKGDVEAISRFRQSGMGVDVKDASQNTALIAAAIRGNSSLVGQLLREGANPNHYNSQGRGALHAAAEVGDVTSLRSLIAHKAETQRTDRENWSALSLAAFAGHVEAVRVLTPVSDHHLDRALHLASLNGDIDIIDALLQAGANIFSRSGNNRTALMYAAENGHLEEARLLVENGANQHALDGDTKTALDIALENDHLELVEFFEALNAGLIGTEVTEAQKSDSWAEVEETEGDPTQTVETVQNIDAEQLSSEELTEMETEELENLVADEAVAAKEPPLVKAVAFDPVKHAALLKSKKPRLAPSSSATAEVSSAVTSSASPDSLSSPLPVARPLMPTRLTGQILSRQSLDQAEPFHPSNEIKMLDFRQSQLPMILRSVEAGSAHVAVNTLEGVSMIVVKEGQQILDTRYRMLAAKTGEQVLHGNSAQAVIQDTNTGERHLLVKDTPAMSSNTYAVLTVKGANGVNGKASRSRFYDARVSDEFSTIVRSNEAVGGEKRMRYRVTAIRPNKTLLENLETGEMLTISRRG